MKPAENHETRVEPDRAQSYLDVVEVLIVALDAERRVTLANRKACSFLEIPESEILGRDGVELFVSAAYHAEAIEKFRSMIEGRSKPVVYSETIVATRSHGQRVIAWRTVPLRDALGAISGTLSAGEDITERKLSADRFRTVFEESPLAKMMVDAEGRITLMNSEVERIFGYERDELHGRNVDMLIPEPLRESHANHRRMFMANPSTRRIATGRDLVGVKKDGAEVPLDITLTPIATSHGTQVLATITDITERKRVENELREKEEHLRHSQRIEAIGRLAGGIAHDFNNQLAVLQCYLEKARRSVSSSDPLLTSLDAMQKVVDRSSALTRQLLLFGRKDPMERRPLRINEHIEELRKMLDRIIGEDVVMRLELAPDLPRIEADPVNLDQVVTNLVVNARHAMPRGGTLTIRTGFVEIEAKATLDHPEARPGRFITLSVSDTGMGIPREIIGRIFDPFFTTKSADKGTGLGLSVVHGIVRSHGGWIAVQSERGCGSTFTTYLPCHLVPLTEARAPGDEVNRTKSPAHGHGERILLVEDEATLRIVVEEFLSEEGYSVHASGTVSEALEAFDREGPFDLIVSDIRLPDGDGRLLIDSLRSNSAGLRAVQISGYASDGARSTAQTEKARILRKPFRMDELLAEMNQVLRAPPPETSPSGS